ncbi:MAG: leucyl aminopeptidase family protein [Pseudomonadota bacterium]
MSPAARIIPLTTTACEAWLASRTESTRNWARASGFQGQAGTSLAVPDDAGHITQVLCGLGRRPSLFGLAPLAGLGLDVPLMLTDEDWADPGTARMALGYRLATYRFDRYRDQGQATELLWPDTPAAAELDAIARATFRVRDLVNTPAEDMGPEQLADAARSLAEAHDADFETIVGDQLLEQNFPAIHAVGRAATRAPRLIDLLWGDPDDPKLTLVGMGVCFDSGGLDITPSAGMRLMKKDMGGAAHVIALAGLIMERQLPVRLRMLVPAVENAIAGNAYRPGDIVSTRSGQTIEIGNTDAEGRVILSDALTLACEEKPDLLIDYATLTGAARVALGPDLPPIFTDDESLSSAWFEASRSVEDPLWRLPLYNGYDEMIDPKIADVSNTGSMPMAGAITAGLFLRRFVAPETPWTHLDVYAWNPVDRPGRPRGGEAHALRACWELLRRRFR